MYFHVSKIKYAQQGLGLASTCSLYYKLYYSRYGYWLRITPSLTYQPAIHPCLHIEAIKCCHIGEKLISLNLQLNCVQFLRCDILSRAN